METKEKKNKTDISIQLWPASREAINKLFFFKGTRSVALSQ